MHAAACAEKVGIPVVIVPPEPGNLCAYGDINMDLHNEVERFFYSSLYKLDINDINTAFADMDAEGTALLLSQDVPIKEKVIKHIISMRYKGQSYELEIECEADLITEETVEKLEKDFHAAHKKIYFVNDPGSEVEITKLRTTVIGVIAEEINIQDAYISDSDADIKLVKAYECRKHKISRISSFSYRYLFYSIRHILVYYFKDPFRSFQHSKPDLFSQLLYTCFCRFDIKPHISGKEFLFIQISQHQICIT